MFSGPPGPVRAQCMFRDTAQATGQPPVSCICVLSVPVLVLVVPPVEVDVERHDAAGDHACDQSPEERNRKIRMSANKSEMDKQTP